MFSSFFPNLSYAKTPRIVVAAIVVFLIASFGPASRHWMRSRRPILHAADFVLRENSHLSLDPVVDFPEVFPGQVAVLLTKSDELPLAVIHVFNAMGIPFFCTHDVSQAVSHPLVFIFPIVDANSFSMRDVDKIRKYVESGGIILAQNVFSQAMQPIFGFSTYNPLRTRHGMSLIGIPDPVLKYLDRAEERQVQLGSPEMPEIIWTNGYTPMPDATVLAKFNDGTAAILTKQLGKGRTYLFGVSLTDTVLRSLQNHDFEAQRWYANRFEPGADIWLLMVRAWYEVNSSTPIRLGTIPSGWRSVLLLSHDIDWEYSVANAKQYSGEEHKLGVSSTFFMQTKYLNDANSRAFFLGSNLDVLRRMKAEGADIESHTVVHSKAFNRAPLGSGLETFANYSIRTTTSDMPAGLTALGEACVSRSLLDGELPGQQTTFFRAGHLRVPHALPEALERCGYEFDSSFTADDVLTSFPYKLDMSFDMQHESSIYEFPVSLEDGELPPLRSRIVRALDLIEAHADNGSPTVLLIHPNDVQDKLATEQELLAKLSPGVAVGNMSEFARFWKARDHVQWNFTRHGHRAIRLEVSTPESVSGLTFDFGRSVKAVTGTPGLRVQGPLVVLPLMQAGNHLTIEVTQ